MHKAISRETFKQGGTKMSKMLVGTDDIRQALGGISESSLMDHIFRDQLPAVRNQDNVFEISRVDLEKWKMRGTIPKEQASDKWHRVEAPKPKAKKKPSLRKSKYNKQK